MTAWFPGFALLIILEAGAVGAELKTLLRVTNPSPSELATLSVRRTVLSDGREQIFITACFPNIPDATCDLWCYESAGLAYVGADPLPDGGVALRHRWEGRDATVTTTATPAADALDLIARVNGTPTEGAPADPPLNVCWQLHSSPAFASLPGVYPDFVKRCFIFKDTGRVFLDETTRRPIPVRGPNDEYNNPPWVQMYVPQSAGDIRSTSTSWADFSPDRYLVPLIGAVSRDGSTMMAVGAGVECTLSQAWHDCMHAHTRWTESPTGEGKEWRIRVYAMRNDPDELLIRYRKDFPSILGWE